MVGMIVGAQQSTLTGDSEGYHQAAACMRKVDDTNIMMYFPSKTDLNISDPDAQWPGHRALSA
jgi:dTDP-4-dehydrorhamnose 3,5-epimerase-like enzyme